MMKALTIFKRQIVETSFNDVLTELSQTEIALVSGGNSKYYDVGNGIGAAEISDGAFELRNMSTGETFGISVTGDGDSVYQMTFNGKTISVDFSSAMKGYASVVVNGAGGVCIPLQFLGTYGR
jgi:hypothetical protein